MPVLFNDARLITCPRGRATTGLWLSVGVHALVAVVLIAIPIGASERTPAPTPLVRSTRTFVMPAAVVTLPPPPVVAPRRPDPPPPPPPPPPVRQMARVDVPKPRPVEPVVARPVEPPPARLVPEPVPVFEAPVEKPVPLPEVGLFERTNAIRTTQAAAAVTTGGFGRAAESPRDGAPAPGTVTTGAFGSAPAPRAAAREVGEVRTSGFDQRASAPARPAAAVATPVTRPVEIVFKPTPEYTEEARSARVEGTVSLELEFTAAGDVRVLRVVSGLGHGLDEAARQAALRIRFTPAQSDGRPVDSRATVHISFRLS